MNWDSIKNILINFKDLLESFFNDCNWIITFILGLIVSTLIASLNNPYYCGLIIGALFLIIILFIILIYYAKKKYVSIKYRAKYYVYFLNSTKSYLFETPSLMLDNSFTTKLSIVVELGEFIQNNLNKKDRTNFYTLVIEKDKSIDINIDPEDIDEKEDKEYSTRNDQYYYFVQEYTGQKTLQFNINFKGFNKVNINKNCKMYLEYGDIHENNCGNFRNEFFNKEFFITDLSSILK